MVREEWVSDGSGKTRSEHTHELGKEWNGSLMVCRMCGGSASRGLSSELTGYVHISLGSCKTSGMVGEGGSLRRRVEHRREKDKPVVAVSLSSIRMEENTFT